jgi:hypothetical protein
MGPLLATWRCSQEYHGIKENRDDDQGSEIDAETEHWQLGLSLGHRCFLWLSQCFQRIEPTFNNWDILHKNCRFLASLENNQETWQPQIWIPTWQQSAKLSSDCAFRQDLCSGLPQSPPLPFAPRHKANARSPSATLLALFFFLRWRNIFLCSLLFYNRKSNWIKGDRTVFLTPAPLLSPNPLGILVCEHCWMELLFLLDHYFSTKRTRGRHGSDLSGKNISQHLSGASFCHLHYQSLF